MDRMKRKSDLSTVSEDLSSLLISIGTPRTVKKGSFLFQEGERADELFLIRSGVFQISKLSLEGKELNMRICKKDDYIGELTLFSENATYMLSAYALEAGEVLTIQRNQLEKALINDAPLTFEFMKWISTQLRKNQSKIRDLIMHGKKGALYSTLIRISNSYGVKMDDGILLDIHLTNQELAKFCAATRESVNRMLSDLKKKGMIDYTPDGRIILLDLGYLREEIGCENCPIDICNID
ncbi:Crp/Fnr family transcriptional regulator [[Bacillus] enclensis]|uniref:CRP/FNR family transcriptional regulator, anaerobic regulatory protein n=1 Tax=[Bacillus] enclensis TaxID=1402860 RepID=A0A0V8HPB7_9BACI|nr:Crp/Fnr family transcriptional regulator [[Bacillus] enclensis]KSU64396.1 Crp/Fnr family transcriptional regulator [[Bacillus] enclensis]SCB73412.1 CRP/FNR family transcriptional regulator, anaerobic regulatory protein [[Bacillus] enclensis]